MTLELDITLGISIGSISIFSFLIWLYFYHKSQLKQKLADIDGLKEIHNQFNDTLNQKFHFSSALEGILNRIDRLFGKHSFSTKSYELCLKWAFVYPIMIGFIFWLITNQDISGFDLFPPMEERQWWYVPVIIVLLALSIFSFYKAIKESGKKAYLWLLLFIAFAAAAGIAGFAIAAISVAAAAGAGGGAIAGFAIAATVVAAVVVAAAGAGGGAIAGVAGVVTGAIAFAVAVSYIVIFCKEKNKLSLFYIFFTPCFLILSSFFIAQPWVLLNETSFGILLFLVILPLVNSLFDWGSLGITRCLLRQSLKASFLGKMLLYILDLIFALVCLFLLIISLASIIKLMGLAAELSPLPQPTYDVRALWDRLQSRGFFASIFSSDGWIYVMVFSTFIPSFIHFLAFVPLLILPFQNRQKLETYIETTKYQLADFKKGEIAGYLVRQSILTYLSYIIAIIILLGGIIVIGTSFFDIIN